MSDEKDATSLLGAAMPRLKTGTFFVSHREWWVPFFSLTSRQPSREENGDGTGVRSALRIQNREVL
jgi:hypothetical protein